MTTQHINLKRIIIEAYDRKETRNSIYMHMNELIRLGPHLPNIEYIGICILHCGTPNDALNGLQSLFSSWNNLKSFDCFIKFAYHHFDTTLLVEIKNHYPLLQDSTVVAWEEKQCTHCRIRKN